VVTRTSLSGRSRVAGAIAIVVIGLAYALLVQRRVRQVGWRAHLYLLVVVLVTGVAAAIDPNFSLLLWIAYPQI
jgi:hypothetical protein